MWLIGGIELGTSAQFCDSLLISLFAGNAAREWFALDCVHRHTVSRFRFSECVAARMSLIAGSQMLCMKRGHRESSRGQRWPGLYEAFSRLEDASAFGSRGSSVRI